MNPNVNPTDTELRNRNISVESPLYNTQTCSVFKAFNHTRNIHIALKLQLYPVYGNTEIAAREITNQQACHHPNIVQLYDYFWYYLQSQNPTHWIGALEIELLDLDLFRHIQQRNSQKQKFSEEEIFEFIREMVSALAAAQELRICHRDVKPHNIFLSKGQYKIGDFGSSKQQLGDPGMMTLAGTPLYLSPALRAGIQYRQRFLTHNPYKSDVFSLGLTALHMAMLAPLSPFEGSIDSQIANALRCLPYSDSLKTYFSMMLQIDEATRPDFIDIRNYLEMGSIEALELEEPGSCVHDQMEKILMPCRHSLCEQCLLTEIQSFQESIIVQCQTCKQTFEYFFQQKISLVDTKKANTQVPPPAEDSAEKCVGCHAQRADVRRVDDGQVQGWYCTQCHPTSLHTTKEAAMQTFNYLAASLRPSRS